MIVNLILERWTSEISALQLENPVSVSGVCLVLSVHLAW